MAVIPVLPEFVYLFDHWPVHGDGTHGQGTVHTCVPFISGIQNEYLY